MTDICLIRMFLGLRFPVLLPAHIFHMAQLKAKRDTANCFFLTEKETAI